LESIKGVVFRGLLNFPLCSGGLEPAFRGSLFHCFPWHRPAIDLGCGFLVSGHYKPASNCRNDPATIAEVEKLALDLPETERAVPGHTYWDRFHRFLHDEDEGIAEALRRDAEFEANPSLGMSLEELDQRIESRRS